MVYRSHSPVSRHKQAGATLTEFLIVTPIIVLLGMIGLQYTLMYNAKSNLSYASYEAARAGAIHHADPLHIQEGLLKGMLPYFNANGNAVGTNAHNLAAAAQLTQLKASEAPFVKVEIVSPSKAAFDDFNNPTLQQMLGTANRAIPNKHTDMQNIGDAVGQASGITIAEANVLKLRVTYGYKPNIPFAKQMFVSVSSFLGGQRDDFALRLLAADRIPIIVDVSAQMLSPAVENGLKTVPYHPGNQAPILVGGKSPTQGSIPPEYQGMTPEQILEIIKKDGGLEGGAGQIGRGRSGKNWLPILIAIGAIAVGSQSGGNGNSGGTGAGGLGDFGALNLNGGTC